MPTSFPFTATRPQICLPSASVDNPRRKDWFPHIERDSLQVLALRKAPVIWTSMVSGCAAFTERCFLALSSSRADHYNGWMCREEGMHPQDTVCGWWDENLWKSYVCRPLWHLGFKHWCSFLEATSPAITQATGSLVTGCSRPTELLPYLAPRDCQLE